MEIIVIIATTWGLFEIIKSANHNEFQVFVSLNWFEHNLSYNSLPMIFLNTMRSSNFQSLAWEKCQLIWEISAKLSICKNVSEGQRWNQLFVQTEHNQKFPKWKQFSASLQKIIASEWWNSNEYDGDNKTIWELNGLLYVWWKTMEQIRLYSFLVVMIVNKMW